MGEGEDWREECGMESFDVLAVMLVEVFAQSGIIRGGRGWIRGRWGVVECRGGFSIGLCS